MVSSGTESSMSAKGRYHAEVCIRSPKEGTARMMELTERERESRVLTDRPI